MRSLLPRVAVMVACLPLLLVLLPSVSASSSVSVDWSNTTAISRTYTTLQMVMNPLVSRQSPVHDAVYSQLGELGSHYTRFQAWFPYPRYSVAELYPPSGLSQCSDVSVGYDVHLSCAKKGGVIDKIEFASFGLPLGQCTNWAVNDSCNAKGSLDMVQSMCQGKQNCTVPATVEMFGDPCPSHSYDYRLAVQVTCNPPQNHTYWNFTLLDEVTLDFLNATEGRDSILDLSTQPNWLYSYADRSPYHVPDSPYAACWDYTDQSQLIDPTAEEVGKYFGRVAAWYHAGGFTDEYGEFHASPYHLDIPYWEVLNEMEHGTDYSTYIKIYDQTVRYVREWADPDHSIKFVGLALEDPTDYEYYRTFLNSSNHLPNTPLDFISYHRYALPDSRIDPVSWESSFTNYDEFFDVVRNVEQIRTALSPSTRTTIDEAGVILPGDNDPTSAPFPVLFWNAAAAAYAYMFAHLAELGVDVLGCSQLMGYTNQTTELGGLSPQYPSVSMVNWTTGAGTARWQALHLLIDEFHVGDELKSTQLTGDEAVYAQAFVTQPDSMAKVLLVNTKSTAQMVSVEGARGSVISIVDEQSGEKPPRKEKVSSDFIKMAPFAVAVLQFPAASPILRVAVQVE